MERVTGIGGIFFKCRDPQAITAWYHDNLGIPVDEHGYTTFNWKDGQTPERPGSTVWGPFPSDTTYFAPSEAPFMFNFRVENLDRMLAQLRERGVTVDEKVEDTDYGRFGWCVDPEGNKIELWEPPVGG